MKIFEDLLTKLGFAPIELMPEGKAVVHRVRLVSEHATNELQELEFITKISYDANTEIANREELEILQKMTPLPGIPHLVNFITPQAEDPEITYLLRKFTNSPGTSSKLPTVLVKSYLPGHTYHEQTAPLNDAQRRELDEEIAFFHSYGFSNFDIKPANILISPGGHTRLFDFDTVYDINVVGKELFYRGVVNDLACSRGIESKRFKPQGTKRPIF